MRNTLFFKQMAKPFKCFDECEVNDMAAITSLKLFEDAKKVLQLIVFAPDLFDEKNKIRPLNAFMKNLHVSLFKA
jgi:hypothetical protein